MRTSLLYLLAALAAHAHAFLRVAAPLTTQRASSGPVMEEDAEGTRSAWTSIDGGPSDLLGKMMKRGKGTALLYYFEELRELYTAVVPDSDKMGQNMFGKSIALDEYIGVAQLSTLMEQLGPDAPSGDAAMSAIADGQGIQRKDEFGEPLIYFEQVRSSLF